MVVVVAGCVPVLSEKHENTVDLWLWLSQAMYGLQSLPSFAEYPLHMQEKLAKVAWYEV